MNFFSSLRKHNVLLFLGILLIISNSTHADNDCVFNPDYKSENPIQNKTILKNSQWNSKSGELHALLNNDDFLYISKWSCVHLGMDAKLITLYSPHELSDHDLLD